MPSGTSTISLSLENDSYSLIRLTYGNTSGYGGFNKVTGEYYINIGAGTAFYPKNSDSSSSEINSITYSSGVVNVSVTLSSSAYRTVLLEPLY